jgi:hypothetical protein
VQRLRKEYNLSEEAFKGIYDNAVRLSGVKRDPISDSLIIDARAADAISTSFEQLAINYRKQNKDGSADVNAQAAALTALQGKLNENVKAQQESNALYGQRIGVSALEAEAELVNQVAAGRLSQADADKAMAGARKQALEEEIKGAIEII